MQVRRKHCTHFKLVIKGVLLTIQLYTPKHLLMNLQVALWKIILLREKVQLLNEHNVKFYANCRFTVIINSLNSSALIRYKQQLFTMILYDKRVTYYQLSARFLTEQQHGICNHDVTFRDVNADSLFSTICTHFGIFFLCLLCRRRLREIFPFGI